ncbi:YggT family protein [Methyloterricola oryzae]|uniref:YggT family protein n=1 Tax=Methyloterricola oryzae TaxID=1495050 RepID=UPI002E14F684
MGERVMDLGYLVNPTVFVVDTLFSLYVFAIMLRFLFQWVEADFYNPISQALVKITHPPLRVLRRFIPSLGRIDTSSLVLMLIVQMLGGYLVFLLQGVSASLAVLSVWALSQLLELFFNVMTFSIIIRALLSWFGSMSYNPASSLLYSLTEPTMRTCRKLIGPIAGIDLSPLIALIALQVGKMVILPPLQQTIALLS